MLVLGGLITVIGAFGLARLQSFYQRIHGPAIIVTLGAGCILLASMLYFTAAQSRLVIHELLISVFVLMTAPVVAMLITLCTGLALLTRQFNRLEYETFMLQ